MFYGSQASICLTHLGRSKGLYRYPDLQIDYTRNSEKAILTHGHNIRKGKTTELQSIVKRIVHLLDGFRSSLGTRTFHSTKFPFWKFSKAFRLPIKGSTLGTRSFTGAVSDFGQVLKSYPREKPLDQSAIPLIAPSQLQPHLYQNIQNPAGCFNDCSLEISNVSNALIGLQ